jgi:hypothetical protein
MQDDVYGFTGLLDRHHIPSCFKHTAMSALGDPVQLRGSHASEQCNVGEQVASAVFPW